MRVLKRIAFLLTILAIGSIVFVFTSMNTGMIDVDLAFKTYTMSIPIALTATFVLGWLFGLLCMGYFALKLVNERRLLRRSLRMSETEVSSLRNLPLTDAD